MRYSIITPSLCRPTLKRLCDSIDSQTNDSWEHLIQVDKPVSALTAAESRLLEDISQPMRGRRTIHFCDKPHKNFGNTCRGTAFDRAQGEYICDIDDDDYYADDKVFETLERVTAVWAIYPVLARGARCHHNPPGLSRTGSAMFIYRRDTGLKFEPNEHYAADGELVERLKKQYPYQSLDRERELVIYPWANHGMEQKEIDERMERTRRRQPLRYAKDGCTIDWFDTARLP